jgi:hypothetical protein
VTERWAGSASAHELARVVAARQVADWRELRFEPITSPDVRRTVAQLAARVRDTFRLELPGASPVSGRHGRAAADFPKADRSTRLSELMERSVFDSALLADFLEAAGQEDASVSPLLQRLARREIERVTWFMRQLPARGEIGYYGEDREWLLGLTEEAEHSIDAISLSTADPGLRGFDGGLWTSDLGTRYLTLQRAATERQVSIRRIFVFENEDLARDETFLKIIQRQRDVGVDVRLLYYQLVPEWLQPLISDFIIFDGAVSYEMTGSTIYYLGGSRPTMARTLLTPMPARVRDLENKFNCGQPLTPTERHLGERSDEQDAGDALCGTALQSTTGQLGKGTTGLSVARLLDQ